MTLSADAQAMLLLCSHLGLTGRSDLAPLTLREWNPLARRLRSSPLQRPGALLGRSAADLAKDLGLTEDAQPSPDRLARLLERGGALAIEMERLGSLGIWASTRADADYPARLRQRLRESAPPVLFGSGRHELIGQPGLAVVGSRHADLRRQELAEQVGNVCGRSGWVLYSGGAAGIDRVATEAAIAARGCAVSVLAHSLEQMLRQPETRSAVERGDLTLLTPYSPNAGFSVGAAMGRNRLIYALADYALVVASDAGKGGTWTGALEALTHRWVPVFVLQGGDTPEGNLQLLQRGALPFPENSAVSSTELRQWLENHSAPLDNRPVQTRMF